MAIIGTYHTPESVISSAYFRIDKVVIIRNEYETIEPIDLADGEEKEHYKLTYANRDEGVATMRVYLDTESRKNLARVVDTFQFKFDYDINSENNPFRQAYEAILNTDYIEDPRSV